jgi:hypothetical protein
VTFQGLKNTMTSLRRRAAHAALLAAAFSLAPLALAQQAPTPERQAATPALQGPTPEQQRAAIDAIAHGQPPRGLPVAPAGAEAKATRAPARGEGAAIKEAVDALHAAIEARRAGKGSAEDVARAVENLRGADALVSASFDDALKRLRDSGASPRFEGRLADARAKVRAPLDGVYEALGACGCRFGRARRHHSPWAAGCRPSRDLARLDATRTAGEPAGAHAGAFPDRGACLSRS